MKNGNEGRIPASEFEPDNGVSSSPSAAGAPYGSLGEAALYYLSQGLSVIPLRQREKIPATAWDEYQTKRPTEEEVRRWWVENPGYNVGVVTGRVSGNLVVIDFDDLEVAKGILGKVGAEIPGVAEKLKHTWVVRTGKGLHVYVRAEHPEAMPRTRSGAGTRVDFRADGGQVVAPPSVHPSGRRYEWMEGHAPWQTGVAVLTDEEMAQLLRIVAPWYTYTGTTQGAAQEGEGRRLTPLPPPTRELSDDEVNEIAEALKEFMTPGHRNPINYKLTAMMIENGIKRESAKKVIGTLMAMALTPEDPVDRLEKEIANVDYHYRNDPNERRLEGRPSLMAECVKALVDKSVPLDVAVKRADAAVGRVTAVLKGRPEPKPPEKTPRLWDKMEWWRRNFLLTTEGEGGVGGEKPKTADVAARVADGMVDGAMIEFVAICTPRGCELYAKDGHTLVDAGVVIEMALGAPGVRRFAGVTLPTLIRWNLLNRAKRAAPEELNPPEWLNTPAGVLDLRSLELIPPGEGGPYFTYVIPAVPDPVVLGRIRRGEYRIEENQVYRLWRGHFDEDNWRYFISSVGTWLAPRRFRHMAWLIGQKGIGKSSLLSALTRAVDPIIAHVSLSAMANYTFGLEGLVGKQVIVQNERAVSVLRNLDLLNRIMGESDYVDVQRKHRGAVVIPSMRSAMFSMNDLPLLKEERGSTLDAFLDRLSIIEMEAPEGFAPRPGMAEEVGPEEALYFLLWSRRRLEENGWKIEKRDEDEIRGMVFEGSWLLAEFWSDCIEEAPRERALAKDVRAVYLAWAKERGVSTVGRNEFYDLLAQRATKIQDAHLKAPAFVGIRLKPGCREKIGANPQSELI